MGPDRGDRLTAGRSYVPRDETAVRAGTHELTNLEMPGDRSDSVLMTVSLLASLTGQVPQTQGSRLKPYHQVYSRSFLREITGLFSIKFLTHFFRFFDT